MNNNHLNQDSIYSEQSGITLVELLIALSILGLVIAIGFSYFFFGQNTFNVGEKQTIVQNQVRHAARFITEELRFANGVVIYSSAADLPVNGRAIYLDNKQIWHRDEDGNLSLVNQGAYNDALFTSLIFQVSAKSGQIIDFTLEAAHFKTPEVEGVQKFSLVSEVTSLNQNTAINNVTGSAISYSLEPEVDNDDDGSGYNLPEGYFAFVDKNDNGRYDDGIDIPVPLNDLLEGPFNTSGYSNIDYPGLIGTDGSLIIPYKDGISIEANSWSPEESIDWTACLDIVIGVDVINNISTKYSINAGRSVYIGDNVSLISEVYIKLSIQAQNNIFAEHSVIQALNGGSSLCIESISGDVRIQGASVTANGAPHSGEPGLRIKASGDIIANHSSLESPIGGTALVIESTGAAVNLDHATVTFKGDQGPSPGIIISANGSLSAINANIESTNLGSRVLIESQNGSILINDATISAKGAPDAGKPGLQIIAANLISTENATLTVNANSDTEIDAGAQITAQGLRIIDLSGAGKNALAPRNPAITGCIALGTINSQNYCGEVSYAFESTNFLIVDPVGEGSQNTHNGQLYLNPTSNNSERAYYIKMNMTGINIIKIDWKNEGHNNHSQSYFVVATTPNQKHNEGVVAGKSVHRSGSFSFSWNEIDVSDLEGDYYVRIHAVRNNQPSVITVKELVVE